MKYLEGSFTESSGGQATDKAWNNTFGKRKKRRCVCGSARFTLKDGEWACGDCSKPLNSDLG